MGHTQPSIAFDTCVARHLIGSKSWNDFWNLSSAVPKNLILSIFLKIDFPRVFKSKNMFNG
ncbi:MAG: hypothetical protein Q8N27_01140 [Candidatus Hydromicrobium sp.]|nr:hypothetical protein [Candidatus Hydromicrobium sp.]